VPEDIARARSAGFDASDYVTGTTLFVDGGMTLLSRLRDGREAGWWRENPGRIFWIDPVTG